MPEVKDVMGEVTVVMQPDEAGLILSQEGKMTVLYPSEDVDNDGELSSPGLYLTVLRILIMDSEKMEEIIQWANNKIAAEGDYLDEDDE